MTLNSEEVSMRTADGVVWVMRVLPLTITTCVQLWAINNHIPPQTTITEDIQEDVINYQSKRPSDKVGRGYAITYS